jgi:hypothetical protein
MTTSGFPAVASLVMLRLRSIASRGLYRDMMAGLCALFAGQCIIVMQFILLRQGEDDDGADDDVDTGPVPVTGPGCCNSHSDATNNVPDLILQCPSGSDSSDDDDAHGPPRRGSSHFLMLINPQ